MSLRIPSQFCNGDGEALSEIAIICEKKQTFGLCVQTPDVEQPRKFCRKQIENCIADMQIFPGRNESGWLMQHDGERRGNVHKFAIYLDVVAPPGCALKSVQVLPLIVTRPAAINSSQCRRDPIPAAEETIEAHALLTPTVIPSEVEAARSESRARPGFQSRVIRKSTSSTPQDFLN